MTRGVSHLMYVGDDDSGIPAPFERRVKLGRAAIVVGLAGRTLTSGTTRKVSTWVAVLGALHELSYQIAGKPRG
jgi:hypothetical protein